MCFFCPVILEAFSPLILRNVGNEVEAESLFVFAGVAFRLPFKNFSCEGLDLFEEWKESLFTSWILQTFVLLALLLQPLRKRWFKIFHFLGDLKLSSPAVILLVIILSWLTIEEMEANRTYIYYLFNLSLQLSENSAWKFLVSFLSGSLPCLIFVWPDLCRNITTDR